MRRPLVVRVAFMLLARFGPEDEGLHGDLLEESCAGRSVGWLWRQVALAIVVSLPGRVRSQARQTVEEIVLAGALVVLAGFCAVVAGNLVHHLALPFEPVMPARRLQYDGWGFVVTAVSCAAAVVAGRVIGRLHERHRMLAVLAFGATATLTVIVRLNLTVPDADAQVWLPDLTRQIAEAILVVIGLLAGALSVRSTGEEPAALWHDPSPS